MTMVFIYWERNYNISHTVEIDMRGKDAEEIMHEYWEIVWAHDLHKYTPIEFCGVI